MSNSNEHIEKFLDDYLGSSISPDYAVLITGCWGSGKTYFIKRYLGGEKKTVEELLIECTRYIVVYVSLFGVKNREDIERKILDILKPELQHKKIDYIPTVGALLTNIVGLTAGVAVAAGSGGLAAPIVAASVASSKALGDGVKFFSEKFVSAMKKGDGSYKKTAIVFDDVERTDMPLPELLGYLNEFVEHRHIPCILLADKDKWEEAQKCQADKSTLHRLSSTKEKVIGKEFEIRTSFDDVWNSWFNSSHDALFLGEKTLNLLKNSRDIIAQVFECSSVSNYRSLKHSLLDFKRFVNGIQDENLTNPEFNSLLIADFIAHQYAYYLGLFDPNEILVDTTNYASLLAKLANQKRMTDSFRIQTNPLNIMNNELTWSVEPCNQENDEKINSYVTFQKSFSELDKLSSLKDSDFAKEWQQIWKNWIIKNDVSFEKINCLIKNSIWYDGKREYDLKGMFNWMKLDDCSGKNALKAFYESIDNKTLRSPSSIMDLFYRFYWYAKKNVLKENASEFEKKMREYVKMIKNDLMDEYMGAWKSNRELDETYTKYERVNDSFLKLLQNLLKEKEISQNNNCVENFWKKLGSDNFNELKDACSQISFRTIDNLESQTFKQLDVEKFCEIYLAIRSNWKHWCYEAIKARYYNVQTNQLNEDLVKTEKNFLKKLKQTARKIYNEAERPLSPSIFSLYYLIRSINDILGETENAA